MSDTQPSMEQVRAYLHQKNKTEKINKFIEDLKVKVSDDFKPAKSSFANNFPLLDSLVSEIKTRLS